MRIAYFGFDLFCGCLERILSSDNEVEAIFTCAVDGDYETNSKTYALASEYGIPITDRRPAAADIEKLADNGVELMVSAGYYYKLPVTDRLMQVNIHPSYLPIGRGPWPQPVAILKGLDALGVTVHKISEKLDCGDILIQKSFPITAYDNLETVTQKAQKIARDLIGRFLKMPDQYWNYAIPQGDGEYWKEPSEDDMSFSIGDGYEKIDRVTRAFFGYKCFMLHRGVKTALKEAVCMRTMPDSLAGAAAVIAIDGGYLAILKTA